MGNYSSINQIHSWDASCYASLISSLLATLNILHLLSRSFFPWLFGSRFGICVQLLYSSSTLLFIFLNLSNCSCILSVAEVPVCVCVCEYKVRLNIRVPIKKILALFGQQKKKNK